jgi:hypothetical protein
MPQSESNSTFLGETSKIVQKWENIWRNIHPASNYRYLLTCDQKNIGTHVIKDYNMKTTPNDKTMTRKHQMTKQ